MKKWSLLLAVLIGCATWVPAGAGEVLGILEIRGIDNLSSAVFELTKTVGQPVPKEIVSLGLYSMLGTMPGMGLEANGTLRALWMADGADKTGTFAFLLPVENGGDAYLASLGQAGWVSQEDPEDGLLKFIVPNGTPIPWPEVVLAKHGATFVAARNEAEARAAGAALPSLPPILPVEGVVAAEIRPAALMKVFGAKFEEGMTQAFRVAPGQADQAAVIGELYAQAYLAAARQLDAAVLGIGVADGHVNLHSRLAPAAGSLFAAWLATVQAPSAAANAVNLPGALYAETMHMGNLDLLAGPYFRYMDRLMAVLPGDIDAAAMAAQMEAARQYWSAMTGDLGLALFPPTRQNPVRFVEYVALKDTEALRETNTKMLAGANEMMAAMNSAGTPAPVRFEFVLGEPRAYRDIPVDRLTYRLTPGELIAAQWPLQRPLELTAEMAWLPDAVIVAVGGEDLTEQVVDRLLDGTGQPIASGSSWKAFYPNPEPRLVDTSHSALFDILRGYLELVDAVTDESTAASIPDGPGHADGLSYLAMNGYMSRLRFSLQDIAAISRKVQEAQQKAMEARMKAFDSMMEADEMDDEDWSDDDDGSDDED